MIGWRMITHRWGADLPMMKTVGYGILPTATETIQAHRRVAFRRGLVRGVVLGAALGAGLFWLVRRVLG